MLILEVGDVKFLWKFYVLATCALAQPVSLQRMTLR